MTDAQRQNLEQKLWAIVNTLRGKMDADAFRNYILGFIFYKYLSENLVAKADALLEGEAYRFADIDKLGSEEDRELIRETMTREVGYFLQPNQLFHVIAKRGIDGDFILGDLMEVLTSIERSTMGLESEDDFDHLFEDLDLTNSKLGHTEDAKNKTIVEILKHLDGIDFRLQDSDSDLLGDAYEYLIGKFAAGAGKKAGEFYSPQSASTILARIVSTGKDRLKSVYDPTCGSGSLLLRTAKEVKEVGTFYGQEMNGSTYNLARMNMLLHGVNHRQFDIQCGNTLEDPKHIEETFEAIVANPPFSANWSAGAVFEKDDRFAPFGRLAPKSKADFAFISHMLYQLDDNGTAAVVMPHGPLFRGAAEGEIRKNIIERNWLDAVIGLPANIFYGTSIPTCILVFKKCRTDEDVLFIDGSELFEKGKNQNVMSAAHVDRIVEAYRSRAEVERFTHLASLDEIRENDFNLNIPRYVDTFVPEPEVDLAAVTAELKKIDAGMAEIDAKIAGFCAELGLEVPV